ncbi:unnamed protein product [Diamesa serratosioi]
MKKRTKNTDLDPENGFAEFGGYMSAKVSKLEEQFLEQQKNLPSGSSGLFSGISIFVNGWTNPSSEELKRIMMDNGGVFHHYERSHTKFVIATNLPDVKLRSNLTKNTNIIKPDWIVDCLKENRIVDFTNYLLYTNQKKSQPQISFKSSNKDSKIEETYISLPKDDETIITDSKEEPSISDFLKNLTAKIQSSSIITTEFKTPATKQEQNQTSSMARTAVDPNFLNEFLNNSRLHHIATLGSGFKFYITDLRKKHSKIFPDREELLTKLDKSEVQSNEECILHIDLDCFFVSVGLLKHPHLRGLPVAVTHSKGRSSGTDQKIKPEECNSLSEIASCSYEARAKGLKNGIFVGEALKLCPDLKTIPYDFDEYKRIAFILYDTIAKYTLDIEATSCDELYVDLKNLLVSCQINCMDFVTFLRSEIFRLTGCTCSAGVGANRLQARLATAKAKPNGQYQLNECDVVEFMMDKSIRDLPGVGRSTEYTLRNLNLVTCRDLQLQRLGTLQQQIGTKFGQTLYNMCRGLDDRKLVFEQIRKSVSVEVNYGIRFTKKTEVEFFMKQMVEELIKRLKDLNKKGKQLTIKVMTRAKDVPVETKKFMGHGVCDSISKSVSLSVLTDDYSIVEMNTLKVINLMNIPPEDLRGLGIQLSKLEDNDSSMTKNNQLLDMFKNQPATSSNRIKILESTVLEVSVKKSSTIVSKSPPRKRGRPSKATTNQPIPKNTNISSIFASSKRTNVVYKKSAQELDLSVLAELPEHIRNQVLKEYEIDQTTSTEEDLTIDLNSDEPEVEIKEVVPVENTTENIFLTDYWRPLIQDWLTTDPDFDCIEILIKSSCQLVRIKDIELLYLVMKFLNRVVDSSGKCKWHEVYNKITEEIQSNMAVVFNKKLYIKEISCLCS